MERSAELAVLSREHHVALEIALRLRRAAQGEEQEVREAALAFWRAEGAEHFRLEEEELLPAFARHVGAQDPDTVRVLVEHLELRRRIADLKASESVQAAELQELGELLAVHVRHEERTLFPRIEATLGERELAAVGAALAAGAAGGR